jgi:hypothetical protein
VNAVRLEARTDNVWDGGAVPPAVALNVSDVGLRVSLLPPSSWAMAAQASPTIRAVNLKTKRGILPPFSAILFT